MAQNSGSPWEKGIMTGKCAITPKKLRQKFQYWDFWHTSSLAPRTFPKLWLPIAHSHPSKPHCWSQWDLQYLCGDVPHNRFPVGFDGEINATEHQHSKQSIRDTIYSLWSACLLLLSVPNSLYPSVTCRAWTKTHQGTNRKVPFSYLKELPRQFWSYTEISPCFQPPSAIFICFPVSI